MGDVEPNASASPPRRSGEAATAGLSWERDGADWPNRHASRHVRAAQIRWHVQQMGSGPVLLLVHGTGASTHSWRALAPLLAENFTVVAPDLPGHAFTERPPERRMSLPGMAAALAELLRALRVDPDLVVGHSAGAAILARMCLDRSIVPDGIVALNGALLPIGGLVGPFLPPLAKLMAHTSFVPRIFARRAADPEVIERLVAQTGSRLDDAGMALYGRLARSPAHAGAALTMMANWDLAALDRELPRLRAPLRLVVGGNDTTIAPADAFRIQEIVPSARIDYLRGVGHLAHEERPVEVAALILRAAQEWRRTAISG